MDQLDATVPVWVWLALTDRRHRRHAGRRPASAPRQPRHRVPRSTHLVRHLDRRRPRLRRRAVALAGRPGRRRLLRRLPHREGPVGRQRVHLRDGLHLLRRTRRLPAQGAVLGRDRRLAVPAFFIFVGAELLETFFWTAYLFGAFLIYTGYKMAFKHDEEIHPERNLLVRLVRRIVPTDPAYHGARFFTRINGRRTATLLFVVLVAVEVTDLIFAIDSVAAILAITTSTFIVWTRTEKGGPSPWGRR